MKNDNWEIVEEGLDPEKAALNETLFALGNGYLGLRGTFEESDLYAGTPFAPTEGAFINGFYESAPIVYGEKFQGFAENKQTILNLANAKTIHLSIDGETFNLLTGRILAYRRVLNLRLGVLRRSLEWESPFGRQVRLEIERLVLHTRQHIALIRFRVTPLNFEAPLTIVSAIDSLIRQSEHAEDDPRLGTQFKGEVLHLLARQVAADTAWMLHRTQTTQLSVACGIRHLLQPSGEIEPYDDGRLSGLRFKVQGKKGVPVILDKFIAYTTSLDAPEENLAAAVQDELAGAAVTGFDALKTEQETYLAAFWEAADVEIEGDTALQRGIRFNLFHLLQATGRDGRTNIAAKGLTGLGYEGHYFWDTEIYILPFFLYTRPEISRKLLEYRYHILDRARQRARQMSHARGALYSWRTINGDECSANFPTGTAQYHINADIAFAIRRYFDATQDEDFMKRCGVEILCETARLWLEAGDFIPSRGNSFCINGVTGPDEYQILVNNNAYTNYMARENLRFACERLAWLRQAEPDTYQALAEKISLDAGESLAWQEAAERMVLPYEPERGIIPQDDAFLGKAVWDFAGTPREHYPLLLHYHPLVVTRYQVCKQADTVLAEFLLNKQFERDQKLRDFTYYEPLTTHDSSLSGAIWGIMAAELGDIGKAYRYFAETATLDLENKHGNTQAGIHAANMAGAWQGIVFGFAGMRAHEGLRFSPVIPAQWRGYAFKVRYRGRQIAVQVTASRASFQLLEGDPIEIQVNTELFKLTSLRDAIQCVQRAC
jgi:alpha,alpha-trehalose phosphorylase